MELLTKASYSDAVTEREKRNLQVAYRAACESIVLLKNDGALPFSGKKLAAFGAGVSRTIKGGTGSGEVNERHSVSILEGLENRGFEITTTSWLRDYEAEYARQRTAFEADRKLKLNPKDIAGSVNKLMAGFRMPIGRAVTMDDITESDTNNCLYVISRQAGEGGDRRLEKGDYLLTDTELRDIKLCAKHYRHFVLAINCGSSMDMAFVEEIGRVEGKDGSGRSEKKDENDGADASGGINAVLYISQLGTEGGNAVADVLSGAVTPSGKLADTWARTYADFPCAEEYGSLGSDPAHAYYREGVYVGYRYFDSFGVEPLYPFGYGLSYTDFAITHISTETEGTKITVNVTVQNTGEKFSGKETVQLYVSAPQNIRGKELFAADTPGEKYKPVTAALGKAYQQLAAFRKTRLLSPGEHEELSLQFDLAEIATFRETDASYILEVGDYIVRIGNSSRHTAPVCVLRLQEEVVVSRHQHICPLQQPLEEFKADLPEGKADAMQREGRQETPLANPIVLLQGEAHASLPVLNIDPAAFRTVTHQYSTPPVYSDDSACAFVEQLSVKEMADIVVGTGMFGGHNRFDLPGSVGNTTSKFWDRGLANIALCDGPAGLRVQKISTVDAKGRVKAVELAISAFEALPKFFKKRLTGDPKKDTLLYQYTTAFPVSAALAQTWNTELLFEVGAAIGEEMKAYGCTYWLAPAVNIHRNPLCGRNFEYYSEDPFLCGTLAAAVIRGVQQEPGFYVTVKHFACNNQEDNRNKVDSVITERALREIYLRAFEICVRKGGAKGIMTSYNKVNGIYAPISYDLCTKVLRNEWGFDGVVMTDWFSTLLVRGNSALALKAGNDLIMPGEPLSKRAIVKAVRKGIISENDLKRCCGNVVKAILDSATQREYRG